jgi:hypothetical protein
MTAYGDAIVALRARLLVIGATAMLAGIAAFVVASVATPRIDVVGYVDIARLAYVDPVGVFRVEMANAPVVLAGQVNSGAFFENADSSPGNGLRRARVIARVPPRADNIELSVRVKNAADGIKAVNEVVQRISAAHRLQQQPLAERLQKRVEMLQAEMDELISARRQLDKAFASGSTRDSMQHYFLVSLRAQSNKEIRELQRMREAALDAIRQMEERPTRLAGNLTPQSASLLVPLAIGILVAMGTALLGAALFVVLGYRQGTRPA